MPIALLAAFAGSLAIHLAALFGPDLPPFGETAEPPPLQVELKPLPPAPASEAPKPQHRRPKPPAHAAKPAPQPEAAAPETPAVPAETASAPEPEKQPEPAASDLAQKSRSTADAAPPAPKQPASGVIRYVVHYGTQGFVVGRAEHRWEFTPDGHYRLQGVTETSGLAALLKTLRYENESTGRLTAQGLQPETYRVRKNGQEVKEGADFDWSAGEVTLAKDGSRHAVAPGTQDVLSLSYQFAWLPKPEEGMRLGVVIGKKYDRFPIDSLGEETLETAAGTFRTLHLRVMLDTVTEIWIALDRYRLPVKIRYTDKNGDVFEQVVTELGTDAGSEPGKP